jgi:ketosteroid isomerase-like protein
MSQENVEVVKAAYRAINSGHDERLLGLAASDVELDVASGLLLDQGTYRGLEGVLEYAESLREVWGNSLRVQVEDYIEQRDHVVVLARISARGKSSGAEVEVPVAHVWTIRAGKIVQFQSFASREEALDTLGLSE